MDTIFWDSMDHGMRLEYVRGAGLSDRLALRKWRALGKDSRSKLSDRAALEYCELVG
jgi:hypothetical protein